MEVRPRTILKYLTPNGECPFDKWFESMKDKQARMIIDGRLVRLRVGNFGDCKSVGNGVMELRIFHGPGFRIYFAEDKGTTVLLLCGGDKKSQKRDIIKAQEYWADYLR